MLALLLLLCLSDAEIRTGAAASQRASLQPSLLSSKCKFDSCDSRSKPGPIPRSYADGALVNLRDLSAAAKILTSEVERIVT
jgi:hypothetical protein